MNTIQEIPDSLIPPALGTIVGFYRIKTPHVDRDSSFETASWWQETTLAPGIYPIKVGSAYYGRGKPLFFYAEGIGTVTDAYFASSFGGVAIGGSNRERYVGKPNRVSIHLAIGDAIRRTGNSVSEESPDVWIDPEWWKALAHYAQTRLANTVAGFEQRHTYSGNRTPRDKASTTKHHAQWIVEDAQLVDDILHQIQYHKDRTPMREATYLKNTEWAGTTPTL
jgi:hypothetical protein